VDLFGPFATQGRLRSAPVFARVILFCSCTRSTRFGWKRKHAISLHDTYACVENMILNRWGRRIQMKRVDNNSTHTRSHNFAALARLYLLFQVNALCHKRIPFQTYILGHIPSFASSRSDRGGQAQRQTKRVRLKHKQKDSAHPFDRMLHTRTHCHTNKKLTTRQKNKQTRKYAAAPPTPRRIFNCLPSTGRVNWTLRRVVT